MTNGERFKQIFSITQVDEGELYAFAWLPNHDAAEFSIDWWSAEYKEPTTNNDVPENNVGKIAPTAKNDLAVDCISRKEAIDTIRQLYLDLASQKAVIDILKALPSVTPQEPRKGYLSIDDVMSVFDDFMCGEVDEDGVEIFLEMLIDKAESEG